MRKKKNLKARLEGVFSCYFERRAVGTAAESITANGKEHGVLSVFLWLTGSCVVFRNTRRNKVILECLFSSLTVFLGC